MAVGLPGTPEWTTNKTTDNVITFTAILCALKRETVLFPWLNAELLCVTGSIQKQLYVHNGHL